MAASSGSSAAEDRLLNTRLFGRLREGKQLALTLEEVEEFFEAVRPGSKGILDTSELQLAITNLASASSDYRCDAERLLRETFLLIETSASLQDKRVRTDQFLQALRLSSREDTLSLARHMHGREWQSKQVCQESVDRSYLISHLKRRRDVIESFYSIPFFFCISILSIILSSYHFGQQSIHRLTAATNRELLQAGFEQSYPHTLWAWLEGRAEASELSRFSNVVGGTRVRKLDLEADELSLRTLCGHNFMDMLTLASSSLEPGEPRICNEGQVADDTAWLLWPLQKGDSHYSESLTRVRSWWTNSSNQAISSNGNGDLLPLLEGPPNVEVRVLAFNVHLRLFVLCRLVFSMPDAGWVVLRNDTMAFRSDPTWATGSEDRTFYMVLDIVLLVLYCALGLFRCFRLISRIRWFGCSHGFKRQSGMSQVVDTLIVLLGIATSVLYSYCNKLTEGLLRFTDGLPPASASNTRYSLSEFENNVLLSSASGLNLAAYIQRLEAASEQAALVVRTTQNLHWLAMFFSMASCVRLLHCFRFVSRLSTFYSALARATKELLNVSLVIGVSLFCFALIGHVAFGARFGIFATMGDAIFSTFALALGFALDTPHQELLVREAPLSTIWLLLLAIVVPLSVFGVVFAIIFSSFMEAKSNVTTRNTESTLSLMKEAYEMLLPCCGSRAKRLQAMAEKQNAETAPSLSPDDSGEKKEDAAEVEKEGGVVEGGGEGGGGRGRALKPSDFWKAQAWWTDAFVIEVLSVGKQVSASPRVSVSSLLEDIQRLNIKLTAADVLQLQFLFKRAVAAQQVDEQTSEFNEGTMSPATVVRFCSRADINVRELTALLRGLELQLQNPERKPSYNGQHMRVDQLDKEMKIEEIENETLATRQLPQPLAESPEPEPPIKNLSAEIPFVARSATSATVVAELERATASAAAIDALVNNSLRNASEAQTLRHGQLDESVERLSQRLEPFLQNASTASHVGATVDPQRLQKLEAKLQQLSQRLGPIFSMDAIVSPNLNVPKGW